VAISEALIKLIHLNGRVLILLLVKVAAAERYSALALCVVNERIGFHEIK
jgi:NADH:ubiquinone oxidoreductase subunit K